LRIVFVSERAPYLPCADTNRAAAGELLAALAARHEVLVLGAAAPDDTERQRRWASRLAVGVEILPAVRWRHALTGAPDLGIRGLGDALARRAPRFAPDVVYLDGTMVAPLAERVGVPTVLAPCPLRTAVTTGHHGLSPFGRVAAYVAAHTDGRWERRWFPMATACVVPSYDERAALAAWLPAERIDVVPAGVDLSRYAYRRNALEGERMVFAGDLGCAPHAEAARHFVMSVLPRIRRAMPRAELLLVGTAPTKWARRFAGIDGVRVMAPVADVRPSVWSAAVCVSPLVSGAARSFLVPAMALGTPVVTSPAGLAAVCDSVVDGQHVLVAHDDAALADAVVTVLGHRVLASTLARNARNLVERRYHWDAITAQYEAVFARVAGYAGERALPLAA
jgi:glycosyltransferase involved in cell wall biosynthesis